MTKTYLFLILTIFIFSCSSRETKTAAAKETTLSLTQAVDSSDTFAEDLTPVPGYRFVIEGDFDGNGKKEKMTEHYFSALTNKETDKFYVNVEYNKLVDLTVQKQPYSFVLADDPAIDTLQISSSLQLFGLSFFRNEGDLNGDGGDELSYVVDWADWSNLNTWHLVTFKDHKWKELYKFPIWNWQLPDVPQSSNHYGLFGTDDKAVISNNDTIAELMQKEMDAFPGLVKKLGNNRIRVIFRNEEASEDTMTVNLEKMKTEGTEE